MTDADSIWESKLSRLQDPNLEKMKPLLVELMGELRERRRERGQPRSPRPAGGCAAAMVEAGVRRSKLVRFPRGTFIEGADGVDQRTRNRPISVRVLDNPPALPDCERRTHR